MKKKYVIWFNKLGKDDIDRVGGKNASLAEMFNHLTGSGIRVPDDFATTAQAFNDYLAFNGLIQPIRQSLSKLNVNDIQALKRTGRCLRRWITEAVFPAELESQIIAAYKQAQARWPAGFSVAVRSSATSEDLPQASFAGQQETFLNVKGVRKLLNAIKQAYASLYNDRAIAYRAHRGFRHVQVALSVGIQRMVRSDLDCSGVVFTLDTESGFDEVVLITASYGLGEAIVKGLVNPDEYYVYKRNISAKKPAVLQRRLGDKSTMMVYSKMQTLTDTVKSIPVGADKRKCFVLSDKELEELARQAMLIERHYGQPMDIEWARDGQDSLLYVVQARPETVKARARTDIMHCYRLRRRPQVLLQGRSVGQRIGSGKVRVIANAAQMNILRPGEILVTDMTDPDWEPVMKRAGAIVTNRGGRTCHAAILARELGIPAVVGCGTATVALKNNMPVTVSCADGETGYIYKGLLDIEVIDLSKKSLPELPINIMLNVGNPERAFELHTLPNSGVGLARLEFIINQLSGIHP
jgi:pyruvate,water dikinase